MAATKDRVVSLTKNTSSGCNNILYRAHTMKQVGWLDRTRQTESSLYRSFLVVYVLVGRAQQRHAAQHPMAGHVRGASGQAHHEDVVAVGALWVLIHRALIQPPFRS